MAIVFFWGAKNEPTFTFFGNVQPHKSAPEQLGPIFMPTKKNKKKTKVVVVVRCDRYGGELVDFAFRWWGLDSNTGRWFNLCF